MTDNNDRPMPSNRTAVTVGALKAVLRNLGHEDHEIEDAFVEANRTGLKDYDPDKTQ